MKKKIKVPPRGRKLLWRTLLIVMVLQLFAFAAAGAALYFIVNIDLTKEFYSAHRSIKSAQDLLLPALAAAGGIGFALSSFFIWFGLRSISRKEAGPIQRADEMLRRLSRGDLTWTPGVIPQRERWILDDTAESTLTALREKAGQVQQASKELHNEVLSLRYKATGKDPLTLKDLREVTGTLDSLCKQLTSSVKWFET